VARRRSRSPRRRPSHGWDSLTKSEWRIARLVGEGRTNPEIAAELVVSRRTVESHLSRIFTKLAVANRTELALNLREFTDDGSRHAP
jgi:DNA-binding NarL/FixJ family response regulator